MSKWIAAIMLIAGCTDQGTAPPPPPTNPAIITGLSPDSAQVGDTIRIIGANFGSSQSGSFVSIGGRLSSVIVSWSDAEIRVEVPLLAATDSARVTVGGTATNGKRFKALNISYAETLNPLFQSTCIGCHGGTNNLFVTSYTNLGLGNSSNGPVVTPGNGEASFLIRMLRGTVSGKPRMPQGGPYLPDANINKFSAWIQQGALNN
jgi:mono/diheme cytochrome c family protein